MKEYLQLDEVYMEKRFYILLMLSLTGSLVMAEETTEANPSTTGGSYENLFRSGSQAEQAEASFEKIVKKKTKEFANVELKDRKDGLSIVFSADALDSGKYTLKLADNCGDKKDTVKLGDFNTSSGNISTEFVKEGMSVGDKFESVIDKFIILTKIPKNGKPSQVGCAPIVKKTTGMPDQQASLGF